MSRYDTFLPNDGSFEYQAEADAGFNMRTEEKWFGTRIRYRVPPARNWNTVIVIDLHPNDLHLVEEVIRRRLGGEQG